MGPFIFNSMTDFLTASKRRSPYSANPTIFENWYKPPNAMTTSTGKEWRNISLAVEETPGHSHLCHVPWIPNLPNLSVHHNSQPTPPNKPTHKHHAHINDYCALT